MQLLNKLLAAMKLQRVTKSESLVLATKQMSGSWLRITDSNDKLLGWTYKCICGFSGGYQPNEVNVTTVHTCACSRFYNLKQSLALNGAATQIVKRETPQKTVGWVGDEPVSDCWSGRRDGTRARAFDSGDPSGISLF